VVALSELGEFTYREVPVEIKPQVRVEGGVKVRAITSRCCSGVSELKRTA
jgi:autonomous glycyl radical cofactor GrcA